ncbi:ABC transporter permease [Cuneatibacter sp. NSJ-177]|uniref:ABC transporter permease n=1 Tax=Cuneatibacter sp. NSJ-177 TaxID=2931401 RepID=UPI001FD53505|nr:ABC transporter permease [Cuneatibacter sp. NSJ-177]MCJ7833775.1 ABC transporter permease [Cuneatibacter sp. NSJ-177]
MKTLKELYAYRQMIFSLVKKELRGRYKGSALGFLWTFINPLLQMAVYGLVFSFLLGSDIPKYYLHLFVALVPWLFFSASLTGGSVSVIASKDMVKKIYFPREIMPISYVTSAFVNMALCFLVIFAVMLLGGTVPPEGEQFQITSLLYLPIIMLVEYVLALGGALLTSALTVYFRDLEHILGILTMAWMYLTPILYSVDLVKNQLIAHGMEHLYWLYCLNPMTPITIAFRDIMYYGQAPHLNTLVNAAVLGLVFLVFGYAVFRKLQKGFAEEL